MKLARMMAHIAGNRLELSELVSEHLGSDAAPPAPEPAEGRGAAYNNNFFLTLAGGINLDITNGKTHLVGWFYILYSRQAGISQTCCAATLASVWPARHAKASFLFCFLLKVQEVQFAWPLTYFSSSDTVAHAGTRRVTRRGTRNTPVATIASCGTPNPHGWLQPHAMAPAAAYAPETCWAPPPTLSHGGYSIVRLRGGTRCGPISYL